MRVGAGVSVLSSDGVRDGLNVTPGSGSASEGIRVGATVGAPVGEGVLVGFGLTLGGKDGSSDGTGVGESGSWSSICFQFKDCILILKRILSISFVSTDTINQAGNYTVIGKFVAANL